jgi:DHA2 family multidrug resistance protein
VHDPTYVRRGIKKIDWWGLSYLVIGVSCIQIMLDKGERLDWFSSELINALTAVGVVAVILFIFQELRTAEPVVDLRVLNNRSFAVGTLFTTIVMFGMYGTFVLVPLFCQQIAGYTPLTAGFVLSTQGVGTFVSILLAGRLFNKIDARILVAAGCLIGCYGSWSMGQFNAQSDFWSIALPGMYRGFSSGLIFVPMTTLCLSSVSKEEMATASGLFNMVRTIGGSIGIAILVAMLSSHAQIHQTYLSQQVDPFRLGVWSHSFPAASGVIGGITRHGSAPFLGMVYQQVQQQSAVMAFDDDFRIIAYLFLFLSPLVFMMRPPHRIGAAVSAH